MVNLKKEFIKTALIGFSIAFLVLFLLYEVITKIVIREKVSQARNIAVTMIYYRHYLSNVSSDIKIINPHLSPFALTPAYTTDQVAKNLRRDKFYVKQVSDRYRSSMDKPKPFELKAINFFKTHKNKKEYYSVHSADKYFNQKHVFYARKLVIEKSCLRCHGVPLKDVPAPLYEKIVKIYGKRAFYYKTGDVRGIISIVFPYEKVLNDAKTIFAVIILIGGVFFFIGLFIFFRIHTNIIDDITKILNHFRHTAEGRYPIMKDKMHFIEFEELKTKINKTFFKIKKYDGTVYYRLNFNPLTNLPNRNKFLESIKNKKRAVVLINIDKFKEINFYFGPKIGDELIKEVAKRLQKLKKEFKFKLFHLDIDEFALLFDEKDKNTLMDKTAQILKILEESYDVRGNDITVRFRAGISLSQKDYLKADIALDMAKAAKKDILFAKKDDDDLNIYEEHLKWLKKIQWALQNDKITLFYQPIVDENENIIKYEGLVRLIDEKNNVIVPFFFLDVAKKSRLYLEITKRVITQAVEKIKKENISVSVNLTLEDIDDENIRNFIFKQIETLTDKSLLTVEIVESEDVRESPLVKEFLKRIKKEKVSLYIDDFGSGYANFDYLIKLNPDGIKIDGSLIKNVLIEKSSEIVVKTIILFAKEMNIKTVAEFVENEKIYKKLKEMGVDYFQGYYFSPPKPEI